MRSSFARGALGLGAVTALTLTLVGLGPRLAPPPQALEALFLSEFLEREAGLDAAERECWTGALVAAELESGVDALLLLAVVERESRFDAAARGSAGSRGLMQLRPPTARWLAGPAGIDLTSDADLHDPANNIRLGALYLARMKDEFGSWELALSAYNLGETRLRARLTSTSQPATRYARDVLVRHAELQRSLEARSVGWSSTRPKNGR